MNPQTIPFEITPMTLADIPHVISVEQAAYGQNFSQKNYAYEIERNQLAHYFVLRVAGKVVSPTESTNIIGVAGLWLIAGQMHIITVATHPHQQGQGLGEWQLLHLIENGLSLGAEAATLEVRPSNQVAISLYKKYAFEEAGRRTAYYQNTGEDALILSTPPLHLPDYQAMLTQRKSELKNGWSKNDLQRMKSSWSKNRNQGEVLYN